MNINSVIKSIGNEKRASEKAPEKAPSTGVRAALAAAAAKIEQEKTASAERGRPTEDLRKMANEVVASGRESEIAQAQKIGAAIFDGFINSAQAYENAAAQMATKVAQEEGVTAEELNLVRALRADPQGTLAKVAASTAAREESEYVEEYNNAVRGIHKMAMDHVAAGYAAMTEALGG